MLKKLLASVLILMISIFTYLPASASATAETGETVKDVSSPALADQSAIITQCREKMVNEKATLYCLEKTLEEAEEQYEQAATKARAHTGTIGAPPSQREAARLLASSALAFENYREAECRRRQNLANDEFESRFTYLACKTVFFRERTALLQPE